MTGKATLSRGHSKVSRMSGGARSIRAAWKEHVAAATLAKSAKVEREIRAEQITKARPPKPARYAFVYKVGIKNDSDKTITEFDWDYVFFDAATGAEIGRRQFTGVEKIGPGKSKELTFQVSSPPAKTISVHALDKNERRGLSEAVVLVRVAYADGSVWLRQ